VGETKDRVRYGDADALCSIKNSGMVNDVEMKCLKCGNVIIYEVMDGCPSCGLITISCKTCGYTYEFGER
jgi:hypothetical protein